MGSTFTLVIMLMAGRSGGPIIMSDYGTEEECITARVAATEYWNETHEAGYRVKFDAECVLTIGSDG